MSWKGFSKAIVRLPQVLSAKVGHADQTVDPEFDTLEQQFTTLDALAKKLNQESTTLKDSISLCLYHQGAFGATLLDVYGLLDESASEKLAGEGVPKQSFQNAQKFHTEMTKLREQIIPYLDEMELKIITPTRQLLELLSKVKKLITKRTHKLIDYDRFRQSVQKLSENTSRDYKDEKKLGALEINLQTATYEYDTLNNTLKSEIPMLLDLRIEFINPLFKDLYYYELKISELVTRVYEGVVGMYDGRDAKSVFAEREHDMLGKLAECKFNRRVLKAGDGSEFKPVASSSIKSVASSSSSSIKPVASSSSSNNDITPILPFAQLHKDNQPPAYSPTTPAPTTYVIALYDYKGEAPGDLSFKRNDRIQVLERKQVNDWWTGTLNGVTGVFPGTYVTDE